MKSQPITAPHVGQMLKKFQKQKRYYQSAWARDQGVNSKTVAKYFKKPTMQIATIFTISQVLKYNFVREVADQLPAELPPHTPNPLETENDALKKENERLKDQIEIWKEAAGVKKAG